MLRRSSTRAARRLRPRLLPCRPSRRNSLRRECRRPRHARKRNPRRSVEPVCFGALMDPLSTTTLEAPVRKPVRNLAGLPLGEIMVAQGAISRERLEEALAVQPERGGRLGEVLVGLKACSEEQVLKALAVQLELPYQMRLSTEEVSQELVAKVPINFAKQARLLPLRMDGDHVVAAVADPLDSGAMDSLRLLLGAS